jgi:hypothetical protein
VLGPESVETLMEMTPPVGWADIATKRDLGAVEERMNLRFEALEHRLLAAFRGELLAQSNIITAQTRTLLVANVGTIVSLAALAFGIAKLT